MSAENALTLAAEKAKADALFASIGEGVIATDEYGKIMKVNEVAEELLDCKESDLIGRGIISTLNAYDMRGNKLDPLERPSMKALLEGKPVTESVLYERLSGGRVPVTLTVSPIILDGKPVGIIEVFRDITREQQIDRAKTEFVSLASHQLRTPLTAIRWYTDLLTKGMMGPLSDAQRASLNEVQNSTLRMIDLVDALLSVARIEVGTLKIEPELGDIKVLAKEVIAELAPQIESKNIKFKETYDKTITPMQLDPDLTRIIFQNLLTNAVKYTPAGGKVALDIKREGRKVHITVSDTGYGVPKAQQKHLFTKLFRADNVRQHDTDGTGLGLYIVQSIVANAKGKIWFESEENKGTTFHVCLPLSGMKASTPSNTRA